MRHVQGSDMRQRFLLLLEVSVSVFCSLSWNLCSQCVARTDRSESSRSVSVETHFIFVTPDSTGLLT